MGCFTVRAKIWRENRTTGVFYILEEADLDRHFISMLVCSCKRYREIANNGNAMWLSRYSRSLEANSTCITIYVYGMCTELAQFCMIFIQDEDMFALLCLNLDGYKFELWYSPSRMMYCFTVRLPSLAEKCKNASFGLVVDYTIGNDTKKGSLLIQYAPLSPKLWIATIENALLDITATWRDVLQDL